MMLWRWRMQLLRLVLAEAGVPMEMGTRTVCQSCRGVPGAGRISALDQLYALLQDKPVWVGGRAMSGVAELCLSKWARHDSPVELVQVLVLVSGWGMDGGEAGGVG